jgi:hypothetical protein
MVLATTDLCLILNLKKADTSDFVSGGGGYGGSIKLYKITSSQNLSRTRRVLLGVHTEAVTWLKKYIEEISVYFDINPHDGLLETHDVDASLKEKLKCLIFIPIISRTYCDPKSFAWEHEFCAFNKLAKEEPSGRDIKLSNGNVASRILPVKIHELDAEDKALLENELSFS